MTELFLSVGFLFLSTCIFMCQHAYVANILDKFQMNDYNLVAIALSKNAKFGKDEQGEDVNLTLCDRIINKLICITNSHFDLMYNIVGIFNRYMNMPKNTYLVRVIIF
jgi:hypothetical protein